MKQITLSPSKLSLYKDCKRCFWLDVNKKVKRPEGAFPSLPSGMDMILKIHFDKFRNNGQLPPEIEGELEGHLFNDVEKLSIWRNNLKGLEYFDKESGIILRGAIDDLFVTDDGFHVPLDFKTRGFPLKEDTKDTYQHQMDIYSFLLEKNGLKSGDFACLIFFHPKNIDGNGSVKFNVDVVKLKTDKERGWKLFKKAVEVLNGEEPEASSDCVWCNWNST